MSRATSEVITSSGLDDSMVTKYDDTDGTMSNEIRGSVIETMIRL